jgi:hypothetical protein
MKAINDPMVKARLEELGKAICMALKTTTKKVSGVKEISLKSEPIRIIKIKFDDNLKKMIVSEVVNEKEPA